MDERLLVVVRAVRHELDGTACPAQGCPYGRPVADLCAGLQRLHLECAMHRTNPPTKPQEARMADLNCPNNATTTTAITDYAEIPRLRVSLVREAGHPYPQPVDLRDPPDLVQFLWKILHDADREHFGAVYLDTRHKMIGYQIAYIGTLTRASVEPRGIFSAALLCNAATLILFHSHPSGDPTPSKEDLATTERMTRAGEVLGIQVLDHIIVGEVARWFSFRHMGLM